MGGLQAFLLDPPHLVGQDGTSGKHGKWVSEAQSPNVELRSNADLWYGQLQYIDIVELPGCFISSCYQTHRLP